MSQLTLPPDYFRTQAQKYQADPKDRKLWLIDQIEKANESLLQYQVELNEISAEVIKLGAAKGSAGALTVAGGILATIPAGYTQVIGGVLMVASGFFQKAENKQKLKRIEDLRTVGVARYNEAVAVGNYKVGYERELMALNFTPYLLTGLSIYLILK